MSFKQKKFRNPGRLFSRLFAAPASHTGPFSAMSNTASERQEDLSPLLAIRLIVATLVFAATLLLCANEILFSVLMLAVCAIAAYDVVWCAIKALMQRKISTPDLLTALAAIAAFLAGQAATAAASLLLYRLLALAVSHTAGRLEAANPDPFRFYHKTATVIRDGMQFPVPLAELEPGDTVIVPPGCQFPANGVINRGRSAIDMSVLMGHEAVREIAPGDAVFSGCTNQTAVVEYTLTASVRDSLAAHVLWAQQATARTKSHAEVNITRIFCIFSTVLVLAALLICCIWGALPAAPFSAALLRVLPLLIAASPAALRSIRLTYHIAVRRALHRGILFAQPTALDDAANTEAIVFNQTGTLTTGIFRISTICSQKMESGVLLQTAAHVAVGSAHPIARTIRDAYTGQFQYDLIKDFSYLPGKGFQAVIDGVTVRLGTHAFMTENRITPNEAPVGDLTVHVALNRQYAGYILLSDSLRDTAVQTVDSLKALGIDTIAMLSGDSRDAASKAAKTIGIDEYFAECTPEDRTAHILHLKQKNVRAPGLLMCIGRTGHDTAALNAADIGVSVNALGSGAGDEISSIALMDNDLSGIPAAIELARETHKAIALNLVLLLAVKLLILVCAAFGTLPLWAAVLFDGAAACLLVSRCGRMASSS